MSSTEDFGFLKTFWRLWKWRNWCDCEDSIFMRGIWSAKIFVFVVSFFPFLSHGKHCTVKGGRGKTKEKFRSDAHLKILPILSSEALEISCSSVNFFSDRDEVLLVTEEFVLTEELGICQCGLPTSEDHDSPEEIDSSNIRPLLCNAPAVPK